MIESIFVIWEGWGQNRAEYDCHILSVPDLASQEWPLKQCFNPGTLVAHWKARFTSLPVTVRCWQIHLLHKYPPVTPLWANSTTVRRPLGKWSQRTGLDNFPFILFYFLFYFYFIFIYLFFFFFSDSNCEEQDIWLHGYKIPSSDPTGGSSLTA